jgi:hypothetical protein
MLQPEEAFIAYAGGKARLFAGREWLVGVSNYGSGQSCFAGVNAGVRILAYKVITLDFPEMTNFLLPVINLT